MLEPIRLATPEEIKAIEAKSDLTGVFSVVKMEHGDGEPSIAVLRQVAEVDPVFGWGDKQGAKFRKQLAFMWGLETHMRLSGCPAYYFNVSASDEDQDYRKVIEGWGAEPTNGKPEIRYRKRL